MTIILTEELIENLMKDTKGIIDYVRDFQFFPLKALNHRIDPNECNILEYFEHLNIFSAYYIPLIREAIYKSKSYRRRAFFESHLIGDYLAEKMLSNDLKKPKIYKGNDHKQVELEHQVIYRFLEDQYIILELLNLSIGINLMEAVIPLSFFKIIKLKIGDAFRIVINHNLRHLSQIRKIAASPGFQKKNTLIFESHLRKV